MRVPGLLGEPRARLRLHGRRDLAARSSSRSRRRASSRVESEPADRQGAREPLRAGVRAPASRRRLHVPDPLGDPAVGRPRLERGGDRRRADGGRPPLRARRRPARAGAASSRAIPTTSRPRCTAGSSICADGEATRFEPPTGLEALAVVPGRAGAHARRPRRAARSRCRSRRPSSTSRTAALLTLGLARGDWDLLARGLQDRLHQQRRAHAVPALARAGRRARELGALGATISGAGPTVLVWCFYEQTGAVAEALQPRGRGLGDAAARAVRAAGRLRRGALSDRRASAARRAPSQAAGSRASSFAGERQVVGAEVGPVVEDRASRARPTRRRRSTSGSTVSKTCSPKRSCSEASASREWTVRMSARFSSTPSSASSGLRLSRASSTTSIACSTPCSAKYCASAVISAWSAATSALTVSRPSDGGQSIRISSYSSARLRERARAASARGPSCRRASARPRRA